MSQVAKTSDGVAEAEVDTNVARLLTAMAMDRPQALAVVAPLPKARPAAYATLTFKQLDELSNVFASGLERLGVRPGQRMVLLVRPGLDFVAFTFALFKLGAVSVLIDPGMGRCNLIRCLTEVVPDGFIAIPQAQAVRWLLRRKFSQAQFNVTVGRRLFWDGVTLDDLRRMGTSEPIGHAAKHDEPAAIIFTTGSTGPPKGVLYCHGNFDAQIRELAECYGIQPGEVDLAGFPLFGLFNAAMGVTTVVPDMDPTRPARVDPAKIVQAVRDWNVTQAFGSPALWNRVGPYCAEHNIRLSSLVRVLSAGAPVPPRVLAQMKGAMAAGGELYTPYGASEALPVASISASEVLGETQFGWAKGGGTCVGRRFPGIEWRVIRCMDDAIANLDESVALAQGEIGELIVSGDVVTRAYATRTEWNALAKIRDGVRVWHRMGDVGYFDNRERFWFCGRMAHRVQTALGTLYTIRCEAVFNQHPSVFRSALVGVGSPGRQRPVIVVEPWPNQRPRGAAARRKLVSELADLSSRHPLCSEILDFLLIREMPVDIRHNAKIGREQLAIWAARRLSA